MAILVVLEVGWLTVTVRVVVLAQEPAAGVNVYVPLAVLLTVDGFQVPVMPLVEVSGNTGLVAPLQMGATGLNVGVTGAGAVKMTWLD